MSQPLYKSGTYNDSIRQPPSVIISIKIQKNSRECGESVVEMKGYQFLQNDFFDLCETRKIRRMPMLLYIYLRGLYCRFQKPTFYWYDKITRKHLGISLNTLSSAKIYLQERGLIAYKSGTGRTPTYYTMLGTVLLPELRVSKSDTLRISTRVCQGIKNRYPIYKSKERLKKKVGIFKGMTERDREKIAKI